MNPPSDNRSTELREPDSPSATSNGVKFGHLVSIHGEVEAKRRVILVMWLNNLVPSLNIPIDVKDDELKACLSNNTVLYQILNRLRPGSVNAVSDSDLVLSTNSEDVKRFLAAVDGLGLPQSETSDVEGSVKDVVDCLVKLRAKNLQNCLDDDNISVAGAKSESLCGIASHNVQVSSESKSGEEQRKVSSESKFQRVLRSAGIGACFYPQAEQSAALTHQVGHKFHEVFQPKNGSYADLPAAKFSEMMKSNSLDNAPTQSLLSVANGILDESVEKRNGEIPHRVACLLRKVMQEIERRISSQAEHLRTQNNLFKAREEKYQSRIRVLEALASGLREESEMVASQLHQLKTEKIVVQEKKKNDEEDLIRLMKEKVHIDMEISTLKQELETTKTTYELRCSRLEAEAKGAKGELNQMSQEYEHLLEDLVNKVKDLEASSDSKNLKWSVKKSQLQDAVDFQFSSLQELKLSWESTKQDVMKQQRLYSEECIRLGENLKSLVDAAEKYDKILAENRRLFNEVQELKGNIRVYCRIRPVLPGLKEKQSIVERIGDNDLVVANPSKEGKEALRSFNFNKIFGPTTPQEDVYSDIQPFIRSVLDGYNACIFAYGQTGSGKTYTMSGPNGATKESLGVNYRALNDLFTISSSRTRSIVYEVAVQMVEIYNEQVRDLLSNDGSKKRLGILVNSQPKGLAVPDASMFLVKSTSDVLHLMGIGLKNRAMSATAMNERSSRSHSVVSINVRGRDMKSGSVLHGNLHLVDLAGSERIDRSEATGDRLKEAQHINKSLSALGDVIFALAQKSSHVPYRNSKLTQLLQSSLGGQAKTLMFVQLNPDVNSFSETLSTLKFAERVSGVELGAARSSKEGKDVRELMEQVASLKYTISKKDEEIAHLQSLKDIKNINSKMQETASLRYGSSIQRKDSIRGTPKLDQDAHSRQSMDDLKYQHEFFQQSKVVGGYIGQNIREKEEILGFTNVGHVERLCNISDSGLSPEFHLPTEGTKSSNSIEKPKVVAKVVRALQKPSPGSSLKVTVSKDSIKKSPSTKIFGISHLRGSKRWQ